MNPRGTDGGGPLISLVCSTVGRPAALRRLLTSVAGSEMADRIELIVVDQSEEQACAAIVREFGLPGPWRVTTSGRGASVGRNAGTLLANADILGFPDDNCWYPPATLRKVSDLLARRPGIGGITGMQLTEAGAHSMLRWLPAATTVSRHNFLRTSICSTIFLRREVLPSLTPFDETIGTGSPGRRGAGEESDLLLRIIDAGHVIEYHPGVQVLQDDDRDQITPAFIEKMAKYGVGQGHLWRRHHLPMSKLAYYSARKLAGAGMRAARGNTLHARADLAFLRGQFNGFIGAES